MEIDATACRIINGFGQQMVYVDKIGEQNSPNDPLFMFWIFGDFKKHENYYGISGKMDKPVWHG